MAGTRRALLDAAYAAAVGRGWAAARMADVAASAGVSRQTLYNEFGSKEALGAALMLRETERFLVGTQAAVATAAGSPAEVAAAAVDYTLREAADNPLLKAVLTDDSGTLLPLLTTRAEPVLDTARGFIAAYLLDRWPDLDVAEVDLVAEATVRLTVSHLVLPTGPPQRTAERIAHLVEKILPLPIRSLP